MMIFATLVLSQVAQAETLPDEIDYVTYRAIVQKSLDESTALRSKADVIKNQISNLEIQISKNQDLIKASNDRINSNDGTSVQLLEENSRRYNEVARLNQDTERLRNELSDLSRQYNSLTQDLNNIDNQLNPARIELQRLDVLWKGIREQGEHAQADYDETSHRLEHKNRDLDDEKNSFQKITNDIQQSTLLVTDLQSRIAPLESQIAKSFDDLNRLNNEHARLMNVSQQAHSQLQAAQQQLSKSQGDLKNAEVVLAPMKDKADSASKAVTQIQGEKNGATLRLSQNEAKLQDAQKSATQLPAQISATQTKADSQKSRSTALDAQIDVLNTDQSQIDDKIKNLQDEIEKTKTQPQTLESIRIIQQDTMKIEALKTNKAKSQQDEAALVKDKSANEGALALTLKSLQDLIAKNDSIAAQITTLKDTKTSMGNELSEIEGRLTSAVSLQVAANRELDLASQGLKSYRDTVAQSQTAVDQKQALADNSDKDINDIVTKKSKTQDSITSQQKSLADIKSQIPIVMNKIEVSKNDAQKSKNRQVEILNDLNDLNRKLRETGNYINKLKDDAQRVSYQYSFMNDQVTRLDSSRSALVAQINQVAQRSGADQNQVEANLDATNNHLGTIQKNIAIVTSLKEMSAQLRNDIANAQSSISTLSRDLDNSRQAFASADNSATIAEAKTASDESARRQREKLYLQYSDEAKSNGSLQGSNLALPLGQSNGKKSANLIGFSIGTKIGAETALLNGRYRGLLRGKLSGDSEGYTAGLNSALDYQRGFDGGYSTGKETARLQALRDSYPVGYKRQRDVLLKNIPPTNIALNNQEDKVTVVNNSGVNSIIRTPIILAINSELRSNATATSDETELSQVEIQNALAIRSAINPQVDQILVSMNEYNRPEKNLSQAQYVYVQPETTPYDASKAQCDDVYKNVAALKADCQSSFKAQFDSTYYAAYKDTFVQNYGGVYSESRTNTFEQRKNETFDTGRNDSYKVVFSEAKTRGAVVAENRGVVDGKDKGYSENIANLQVEYDKLGASKADAYFQSNGVIRSLANGLISTTDPRGLAQGSVAKLGLKLANFGFADTYRNDVVVSFKALTDNVTILNPKTTLRGLPKQSRIDLSNVSDIKISDDAVPGSKVSIKATLYFKGDELNPSYEQETLLEGVVGVNPEIGSSYAFEDSAVYRKWIFAPFKWKFRSHDIDVTLKGLRDNVPAGYTVEISIVDGADYVQLDNSSVKTEAISRGETSDAKFTYTFIQKIKNDVKLKFKVKIKYQDEVLEEKIINVTGTN